MNQNTQYSVDKVLDRTTNKRRQLYSSARYLRQSGVSLIELLISITLSLLLLTGVAVLYMNTFVMQNDSSQMVTLNDNARTALTIISRHLRSAGYYNGLGSGSVDTGALTVSNDCAGLASALNTTTPFMAGRSSLNMLGGCASGQAGNYTAANGSPSDWLLFKGTSGSNLTFNSDDAVNELQANTNYIFANTLEGKLFRGKTPPSTPTDEEIREYQFSLFYLRNNQLMLTRLVDDGLVESVISNNVTSMRVILGIDETGNGQINRYEAVPASSTSWTANNWKQVKSAEIFLLTSSDPNPGYQDNRTYQLGDITVDPAGDNRHRSLASTTVYLYNQAFR